MDTSHQIASVAPESPAAKAGVEPMDIIREINGVSLIYIFDLCLSNHIFLLI